MDWISTVAICTTILLSVALVVAGVGVLVWMNEAETWNASKMKNRIAAERIATAERERREALPASTRESK